MAGPGTEPARQGRVPPPEALPAAGGVPWRHDLSNALLLVVALLLGLYLVTRPVAFQWAPYSVDSAMAGLLAVLLALAAWGVGRTWPAARRAGGPLAPTLPSEGLLAALVLWLGLNLLGLLRSPNAGAGFPRAMEAGVDALLLLSAFALARAWPELTAAAARLMVAMGLTEAFLGVWQKFIELPRLREMAQAREVMVPEALTSEQGFARLHSDEIFGTFGNANSYAAFLLITILLQLGLWRDCRARRAPGARMISAADLGHGACLAVQGYGLFISGSKGAWVAGLAGLWFFAAQALATTPDRARMLRRITVAGVVSMLLLLVAAAAGLVETGRFGDSMAVRFNYWRTGWGMVKEQPLLGLGLGAFGDAFAQFKTFLATETRETHNDWLQLWTELGLLAPLAWGLLWFLVLRAGPPRTAGSRARTATDLEDRATEGTSRQRRTRTLGVLMLGGGLLAVAFLELAFGRLNAPDLWRLPEMLSGEAVPRGTLGGVIAAFLTPLVLIAGWLLLGLPRRHAARPPGAGFAWGARAAIGAILIHELVDFDLTAQAVMAALFVLAGLLLATQTAEAEGAAGVPPAANRSTGGTPVAPLANAIAHPQLGAQRGPLARVAIYAWPVLALALVPGAVIVPLNSGLARQLAEADEDVLRQLAARLAQARAEERAVAETSQALQETRESIVRRREDAFAWAPFDGQAALDLAMAYDSLWRGGRAAWTPRGSEGKAQAVEELVRERLRDAARLRPRWAGVPALLGHVAFGEGWRTLEAGSVPAARERFHQAEEYYREAARLYPLAPALRLMVGDALLAQGRVQEAAAAYRAGWLVDQRILDPNVCFASIFHDPLPGCLAKHGRDADVFALIGYDLSSAEWPRAIREGLYVRQMLAAAGLYFRTRLSLPLRPAAARLAEDHLLLSCGALAGAAPDDAHAVLFYAAALARFRRTGEEALRIARQAGRQGLALAAVVPLPWAAALALAQAVADEQQGPRLAWEAAVQLQDESVRRGRPGTLPQVFGQLRSTLYPK